MTTGKDDLLDGLIAVVNEEKAEEEERSKLLVSRAEIQAVADYLFELAGGVDHVPLDRREELLESFASFMSCLADDIQGGKDAWKETVGGLVFNIEANIRNKTCYARLVLGKEKNPYGVRCQEPDTHTGVHAAIVDGMRVTWKANQ